MDTSMVGGGVRHGGARNLLFGIAIGPTIVLVSGLSAANPTEDHQELLDRYCVTCHNDALHDRGTVPVSLESVDLSHVPAEAELWEKVVRKLRTRSMPPVGRPRPDQAALDGLATALEEDINRAAAARPDPGEPSPFTDSTAPSTRTQFATCWRSTSTRRPSSRLTTKATGSTT